jgi:hypothetical protein
MTDRFINLFKRNIDTKEVVVVRLSLKGQAALEYLVTYGWAFIVIIGAVSILAYFGLINPTRYVPESCEFGEQISCLDHYVDNNSVVLLRLKNNFERDIEISGGEGEFILWHGDPALPPSNPVVIKAGEIARVQLVVVGKTIYAGDKERFEATLTFKRDGGLIEHNISGNFYAEVNDASLNLLN